jgi:hypothetical protein
MDEYGTQIRTYYDPTKYKTPLEQRGIMSSAVRDTTRPVP